MQCRKPADGRRQGLANAGSPRACPERLLSKGGHGSAGPVGTGVRCKRDRGRRGGHEQRGK